MKNTVINKFYFNSTPKNLCSIDLNRGFLYTLREVNAMDKYTFGKNLYELRNKKGLTQKELGKLLGVSDKAVSKWETGEAMPRTAKLVLITDLFGVTMEQLSSEDFDCNAEDFQQNETPEQKESRYKKYFDNAMKSHYRGCKLSFVISITALIISVIAIIGTTVMGGVAGISVTLWELVIAYLLPIFILVYCLLLLYKIYKNKEKTELSDFVPFIISLIVFSVIFCVFGFINEINSEDILNVIGCLTTVFALLVELKYIKSKKQNSFTKTKAVAILAFASLGLVISLFAHIDNIVAVFILYSQLNLIAGSCDLLLVKIITSVLENDNTVVQKDTKKKKFLKRTLIITIVSFVIVSLLFVIFPGIGLKLSCQAMQRGQEINVQWEAEDVYFKKGESKRISMDWFSVEIPRELKKSDFESSFENTITEIYKKENVAYVTVQKLTDNPYADFDLFEITDEASEEDNAVDEMYLLNFQKEFGKIPSSMYEYQRLAASLDADDMKIWDYPQCVLYTQLIATAQIASFGGSNEIYYVDTDRTYGEITLILPVTEEDESIMANYSVVDKYNLDVSYSIIVRIPDGDMDLLHKIINSVEIDL